MIRIVSPSGVIDPKYIENAAQVLRTWGYKVDEGRFAREKYGRFAGTPEQRIADLQEAIDNPDVDVVLCSRGGYGLAQIIDKIKFNESTLFCGFSDITAIHNALAQKNIASVHSIMAKHLTELPADAEPKKYLREILSGHKPCYTLPSEPQNRTGNVMGVLRGGNLSVLYGLRGTPYDLPWKDSVLFIEDICEKPYHIDRMMQNLRLGGVLAQISGLVVGQFSDCDEDPLMMQSISQIILNAVKDYHYPVCFNFPAGHVEYNLPLLLNTSVTLSVTDTGTTLKFL